MFYTVDVPGVGKVLVPKTSIKEVKEGEPIEKPAVLCSEDKLVFALEEYYPEQTRNVSY